jgi:hypothetical protein
MFPVRAALLWQVFRIHRLMACAAVAAHEWLSRELTGVGCMNGGGLQVLGFFESCGFRCPERKGVADFLQVRVFFVSFLYLE